MNFHENIFPFKRRSSHRGAALIMGMLTVALVTVVVAGGLEQQWRNYEIEKNERIRIRYYWILTAALDWARDILKRDAETTNSDNFFEEWNNPIISKELESLGVFNHEPSNEENTTVHLEGKIKDQQGLMNIFNLLSDGELSINTQIAFSRLFSQLQIPEEEFRDFCSKLLSTKNSGAFASITPTNFSQLVWLNISSKTIDKLKNYVTFLPKKTLINVNTASSQVIYASMPGLTMEQAEAIVSLRAEKTFFSIPELLKSASISIAKVDISQIGVESNFFSVSIEIDTEERSKRECSLLERSVVETKTIWREPC